jgi:hypothetical protein
VILERVPLRLWRSSPLGASATGTFQSSTTPLARLQQTASGATPFHHPEWARLVADCCGFRASRRQRMTRRPRSGPFCRWSRCAVSSAGRDGGAAPHRSLPPLVFKTDALQRGSRRWNSTTRRSARLSVSTAVPARQPPIRESRDAAGSLRQLGRSATVLSLRSGRKSFRHRSS